MAVIIVVPRQPGYNQVFRNRTGMLGRDLTKRARRVEVAARAKAGYRTGRLKASISSQWVRSRPDELVKKVGSDVNYALVHHEGSRPHVIRARNAKVLRFVSKSGDVVFARQVNHPGTKPNKYLTAALPLALT